MEKLFVFQLTIKKETICMHDENMIAFIRSMGDLSVMTWSKQFQFEKLAGAKVLHVYIGAVGYGGTNIDCENNSLDVVFFAMGQFYSSMFNRKNNILTMSIQLSKRPNLDLKDLAYVKIGEAVLVNQPYVPDNIRQAINTCDKIVKPLFTKSFGNLAQFSFTFVIVIIPVKISFVLSAAMGVDLVATLCPSKLVLNVGVEPWFTLAVRADAGISIFIASGGLSVKAEFNYRLKPSVGTSNCNICAILAQQIIPITITVGAYVEAIILGRKDFEIYKWQGPVINNELFRLCLKKEQNMTLREQLLEPLQLTVVMLHNLLQLHKLIKHLHLLLNLHLLLKLILKCLHNKQVINQFKIQENLIALVQLHLKKVQKLVYNQMEVNNHLMEVNKDQMEVNKDQMEVKVHMELHKIINN